MSDKGMNGITSGAGNEKKKILLVDDDATHLVATRAMLEKDYEVTIANSGQEALTFFHGGLVPHLVLLDIIMPEMDGWATYEQVRAAGSLQNVPIAFFSSSDEPGNRSRALQIGAVDFITKPARKTELLERVKKLI